MTVTIPEPGTLVLVKGSKVGWFRREKLIAQVLTLEPNSGIVHISLYWDSPHLDWLPVEIGLIPILASTLQKSIVEVIGPRPVGNDWWRALQEWRALKTEGTAGAFFLPIWEIRSMAWETVHEHQPAATRESLYLEYVYPSRKKSENSFRSVRVVTWPRVTPSQFDPSSAERILIRPSTRESFVQAARSQMFSRGARAINLSRNPRRSLWGMNAPQ